MEKLQFISFLKSQGIKNYKTLPRSEKERLKQVYEQEQRNKWKIYEAIIKEMLLDKIEKEDIENEPYHLNRKC